MIDLFLYRNYQGQIVYLDYENTEEEVKDLFTCNHSRNDVCPKCAIAYQSERVLQPKNKISQHLYKAKNIAGFNNVLINC